MTKIYEDKTFTVYQLLLNDGYLVITVMLTGSVPVMSTVYVPTGAA